MALELVKVGETGVVTTDELEGYSDGLAAVVIDILRNILLCGVLVGLGLGDHFMCTLKDVVHLITGVLSVTEILLLLCV